MKRKEFERLGELPKGIILKGIMDLTLQESIYYNPNYSFLDFYNYIPNKDTNSHTINPIYLDVGGSIFDSKNIKLDEIGKLPTIRILTITEDSKFEKKQEAVKILKYLQEFKKCDSELAQAFKGFQSKENRSYIVPIWAPTGFINPHLSYASCRFFGTFKLKLNENLQENKRTFAPMSIKYMLERYYNLKQIIPSHIKTKTKEKNLEISLTKKDNSIHIQPLRQLKRALERKDKKYITTHYVHYY